MYPSVDPILSGRLVDALQAIRGDFEAEPGLALTPEAGSLRFHLPADRLRAVFEALVDVRFLRRMVDGTYVHRAESAEPCEGVSHGAR
jgi:hypothetical protein